MTQGPSPAADLAANAAFRQKWMKGYIEMFRSFNLDLSVGITNLRRLILIFIYIFY